MDKISAWMDGELDDRQAHEEFTRLKQDGGLADGWNTYHIVGDSLRGDPVLSAQFNRRMIERMSAEPTILAPQRSRVKRAMTYALSAAASVAAVALVGWVAFVSSPVVEVAQAPVTSPAPAAIPATQLASVPSDGKMNEYLIAHQEFSPSTSIQGVAPYIRTVSSSQDKDR